MSVIISKSLITSLIIVTHKEINYVREISENELTDLSESVIINDIR